MAINPYEIKKEDNFVRLQDSLFSKLYDFVLFFFFLGLLRFEIYFLEKSLARSESPLLFFQNFLAQALAESRWLDAFPLGIVLLLLILSFLAWGLNRQALLEKNLGMTTQKKIFFLTLKRDFFPLNEMIRFSLGRKNAKSRYSLWLETHSFKPVLLAQDLRKERLKEIAVCFQGFARLPLVQK